MGNVCARPSVLNSPRATADNYIVVHEAGGTAPVSYRFGAQASKPPPACPPNVTPSPAQPVQHTPSTTANTGSSSRDKAQNSVQPQASEVQQPARQPAPQPCEIASQVAPDVDSMLASSNVTMMPTAPFSWQKGRQIGQGAFGTVYMGLVHATGQEIAVKQVSLPRDAASNGKVSDHIRLLEGEVAVLRKLRHENIVRYLGTERTGEHLNIFLEYVAGGPISNKLAQFGPLREETIRVYTKQILRGLEYLHKMKVMHRDIKGANILVDTNGIVKLADFGASKQIEELATIGGGARSIRGTANWMAPEVIKQSGHGRTADIWSLGCVVIEMATGRAPWSNFRDPYAVMFHVASTKELPTMPDWLSPHAKDFLTLCFNRVPHERPNATRLLQHPWMQGVPVPRATAAPPAMLPIPPALPLPPATQAPDSQQQQQPLAAAAPPQPPAPAPLQPPQQQQLPPPPGLRSPPSPIKEECDSRFGSPAAAGATTVGCSTPTTARTALLNAAGQPPRPAVPMLPLKEMKMGILSAQPMSQTASSSAPGSQRTAPMPPTLPPIAPPKSPAPAPPPPPPPPQQQQQQPEASYPQNQQYDTMVDTDAVRMQLQYLQQQAQQLDNAHDSICMGVGMTISIGDPSANACRASTMTLSGFNPVEEPSWMPHQFHNHQAFFQHLAAVSERSVPGSPAGSSHGCNSAERPDMAASTSQPDTCKAAAAPLSGELQPATGTPRSGTGSQRLTGRGGKMMGVPSRPALAGVFAAAYEPEDGEFPPPEVDQPSTAGSVVASPNTVRVAAPQQGTRPRVSQSRRALEEAGILGGGTLDPARAKQYRDELVAELEAERMRAAAAAYPRESIAQTAMAAVGGRPSVADL
ncbi:hypothetical protein Agub_g15237 [Astrephomene gubernaculifera]|uniref:Protein kinase domain-containing protein n=1 Tax=Astrephomene gubernaculifera TaxID=47775 RepID=A0AAD3E2S0_9CHLO|nr:hypothetical protein Agub_g15237 [Astrephomene gubernaculifera]